MCWSRFSVFSGADDFRWKGNTLCGYVLLQHNGLQPDDGFFINTSSSMWRQGCTLCVFCNSCSAFEGEVTRAAHESVSCVNEHRLFLCSIKCRSYTWTMETNHWILSIILLIVMWPFVTTWKHISAYFALQQDFIPPSFCDKGGCYYHWISLFYLFESVLQLLRQCSVIFFLSAITDDEFLLLKDSMNALVLDLDYPALRKNKNIETFLIRCK